MISPIVIVCSCLELREQLRRLLVQVLDEGNYCYLGMLDACEAIHHYLGSAEPVLIVMEADAEPKIMDMVAQEPRFEQTATIVVTSEGPLTCGQADCYVAESDIKTKLAEQARLLLEARAAALQEVAAV